jgi:hypothetical protein
MRVHGLAWEEGWSAWFLAIDPAPMCLSLQVSAGSVHPATASFTVQAPPSGSAGFLSIERLDTQPPRVGDTLNLNLRTVGISGATFSHYYYMVGITGEYSRAGVQESPLDQPGAGPGLGVYNEENNIFASCLGSDPIPG